MTILFLNLQIIGLDIRPHKVCGQPDDAYGHFNLPRGFVWVCMGTHEYSVSGMTKRTNINLALVQLRQQDYAP